MKSKAKSSALCSGQGDFQLQLKRRPAMHMARVQSRSCSPVQSPSLTSTPPRSKVAFADFANFSNVARSLGRKRPKVVGIELLDTLLGKVGTTPAPPKRIVGISLSLIQLYPTSLLLAVTRWSPYLGACSLLFKGACSLWSIMYKYTAALLKVATGAKLDRGRIAISSVDGSGLFSLERLAGSGFPFHSRRPAPSPDVLKCTLSEEEEKILENIHNIRVNKRVEINAFAPAITSVNEVVGIINGVKIRIIDTPSLRSSVKEKATNWKILASIKKSINKSPPDVVLYVDRLDTHYRDRNDLLLLRSLSRTLTSSIWNGAIVTLTHAASPPPDGPSGSSLGFESHPHLKLPTDMSGEDIDSDMDLVDLSDCDGEDEDGYDQLPPFKPLRKSQEIKKRGKNNINDYHDIGEDVDPEDEGPTPVPVPLPDLVLPHSFDSDNHSYRYRVLEHASQFLVRPVLDA
ncbi:hypothetical protein NC652_022316 [Populus alba x Populus x berolinensis]|nr:hypothetical protein NC652_022316 [Populus alba x Populus x berolinensis]